MFIYRSKYGENVSILISVFLEVIWAHEGPTQGLEDTTLIAEVKSPINFTQPRKIFK